VTSARTASHPRLSVVHDDAVYDIETSDEAIATAALAGLPTAAASAAAGRLGSSAPAASCVPAGSPEPAPHRRRAEVPTSRGSTRGGVARPSGLGPCPGRGSRRGAGAMSGRFSSGPRAQRPRRTRRTRARRPRAGCLHAASDLLDPLGLSLASLAFEFGMPGQTVRPFDARCWGASGVYPGVGRETPDGSRLSFAGEPVHA
jgi:hypothetical protein